MYGAWPVALEPVVPPAAGVLPEPRACPLSVLAGASEGAGELASVPEVSPVSGLRVGSVGLGLTVPAGGLLLVLALLEVCATGAVLDVLVLLLVVGAGDAPVELAVLALLAVAGAGVELAVLALVVVGAVSGALELAGVVGVVSEGCVVAGCGAALVLPGEVAAGSALGVLVLAVLVLLGGEAGAVLSVL